MPRWLKFVIALLVGLGAGMLYGWVISPVTYVDTTPASLREDYHTDYVLMVAEVFQSEHNIETAARRLALLGSDPPAEIAGRAMVYARNNKYSEPDLILLKKLDDALQAWQGAPPEGTP
jgi:hypothetical protein